MYIPEELKVNKFVNVHLPDNMSLFSRFGQFSPGTQLYSGDEAVIMEQNKVDELANYQRYAEMMASQHYQKDE